MDEHVDGSQIRSQAIADTDQALAEAHSLLERAEAELREIEIAITRFGLGDESRCEVCSTAVEPGKTLCAEHDLSD
jgi:hypothetical protein